MKESRYVQEHIYLLKMKAVQHSPPACAIHDAWTQKSPSGGGICNMSRFPAARFSEPLKHTSVIGERGEPAGSRRLVLSSLA
jgi:hypothetical protein